MARIILHIDMDAFYAAVEQRERPCFAHWPVIVGSLPGGRGVVSTCSYEARKYGVHSAMPISEAYRRCPQGVYLRGNFRLYKEISDQVMNILGRFSPVVEPVSIDEAFVDVTGTEKLFGPPEVLGEKVKQAIHAETRLTASVGIGPNRLIAKIASDFNKPDGLTVVPPDKVLDFLAPLPVKRLRGVGPRAQRILEQAGFFKVVHLRQLSLEKLCEKFGDNMGNMLYRQSRGMGSDRVGDPHGRKSISKEHTYGEDVTDPETIRQTLLLLSSGIGREARRKGLAGCTVSIKIRLKGFETHTRQKKVDGGTNSDRKIFETGWELFCASGFSGQAIRLIGIGITDWCDRPGTQMNIFHRDDPKERNLYKALDSISEKFGKNTIGLGAIRKKPEKKDR